RVVAVHRDGGVAGVVGAGLVATRRVIVVAFPEPGLDHTRAPLDRVVPGVVAVADLLGEEGLDLIAVVGLPGLDVGVQPAIDFLAGHGADPSQPRTLARVSGMSNGPRKVGVIGVPTSAGAFAPGQEQAPAALREAGLVALLRDAGVEVSDYGDREV